MATKAKKTKSTNSIGAYKNRLDAPMNIIITKKPKGNTKKSTKK